MEWFRFYHGALLDRKVQELSPIYFKHWVNLLCMASMGGHEGELPEVKDIAYILRIKPSDCEVVTGKLRALGLLDVTPSGRYIPHNWSERQKKSDSSAPRVAAHRERKAAKEAISGDLGNVTSNVTGNASSNASVTGVTLLDERRGEEIRREENNTAYAVSETSSLSALEPSSPSQVTSSQNALPERREDETDMSYWQRVVKDERSAQKQIALLVALAHEKIGVPLEPSSYARIGKLGKERTSALLVRDILGASGQHIDGDPIGYLTALINRSKKREEGYSNGNGNGNGRTGTTGARAGAAQPNGTGGAGGAGASKHGRYADVFKRATPPPGAAAAAVSGA